MKAMGLVITGVIAGGAGLLYYFVLRPLPQPATLFGQVFNMAAEPLSHVLVSANQEGAVFKYEWYTDENGYYELSGLPPGTYIVTFTHADYRPLTKTVTMAGKDKQVDVQMI